MKDLTYDDCVEIAKNIDADKFYAEISKEELIVKFQAVSAMLFHLTKDIGIPPTEMFRLLKKLENILKTFLLG